MVIVFGTRLFGRVDRVPGVFQVATQFFHIMMIPLVPTGSFIMLADRGTPLVWLSWKSVLVAWLTLVATFVAVLMALIGLGGGRTFQALDWLAVVAAEATALAIIFLPSRVKPSYHRACDLGREAGLDDREWTLLNSAYGRNETSRPAS